MSERSGKHLAQRTIEQRQREWRANVCGATPVDGSGCFASLKDNLFQRRLSPAFRKGFLGGSGNELAAKIRSLNSSAALVVNVFQSLLESERAAQIIDEIFDLCSEDGPFCFAAEAQFYTGAGGKPANLDLLINTPTKKFSLEWRLQCLGRDCAAIFGIFTFSLFLTRVGPRLQQLVRRPEGAQNLRR